MAIDLNQQMMMIHHLKLILKHQKNIEQAIDHVIPNLASRNHHKLKRLLSNLRHGMSLEDALQEHHKVFHPYVTQALSLMSHQKHYDYILDQTIHNLEMVQKRTRLRQKATRYPMILSFFIVLVVIGFLLFLLPFIKRMYQTFQIETSFMMNVIETISNYVKGHILLIMMMIVMVMISAIIAVKNVNLKRNLYYFFHHRLHMFKRMQLHFYIQFFTYLHVLLLEKKSVIHVLKTITFRFRHTVFEFDLNQIYDDVLVGKSLSESLLDSKLFDVTIVQIFSQAQSDEQIQSTASILRQYYFDELTMRDHQFYSLLEPILISVLSLFVGLIAWMIYEPILSIYEGL